MEPRVEAATLSTYFIPISDTSRRSLLSVYGEWPNYVFSHDLFLSASPDVVDQIRSSMDNNVAFGRWAGCSRAQLQTDLPVPPLPCRTAAATEHCVDGERHCGTLEENSMDPTLEINVEDVPVDHYLFTVEFYLPADPVTGSLLFRPFYQSGGTGYTIDLYDGGHGPLKEGCLPLSEQSVAAYSDGLVYVQHRCASTTASERTLRELSLARFVKITLPGMFRQIWIDRVKVVFRRMFEIVPSPPPTPSLPHTPPYMAPPDSPSTERTCYDFPGKTWSPLEYIRLVEEPCRLSTSQCCDLAHEHPSATGFLLSSSGCCVLVQLATTEDPVIPAGWAPASSGVVA